MNKVMSAKSADSNFVKQYNQTKILNLINDIGPVSKVTIADKMNLTFTTVTNIVSQLELKGLIVESGFDSSKGGRKPILYDLNKNILYIVSVELIYNKIRATIFNLKTEIIERNEIKITPATSSENIIRLIFKAIDNILLKSKITLEFIYGIAVTSPGPVDNEKGIVLNAPQFKSWSMIPLKEIIENKYNLLTVVEKDSNAATYGEMWNGVAKSRKNVVTLQINYGIGGGIVIDKNIYYGSTRGAGELGHGTLDIAGPKCDCGNYGCLEVFSSIVAIEKNINKELSSGKESTLRNLYDKNPNSITIKSIVEAAQKGDTLSIDVLQKAGKYIGASVANIVNYLNPEIVVLGGLLIEMYPNIMNVIVSEAKARAIDKFYDHTDIKKSILGESVDSIGAAAIVIQNIFNNSETIK